MGVPAYELLQSITLKNRERERGGETLHLIRSESWINVLIRSGFIIRKLCFRLQMNTPPPPSCFLFFFSVCLFFK